MKLVTKLAVLATLTTFMFAGVNLTWGNMYTDDSGIKAEGSFGVHFDVNDNTTVGWENGLMVGLAGPAGATFRLGMAEGAPTLGMSYAWWTGGGTGWGTNLSTALDFDLTGDNGFDITVNLGLGF